MLRPSFLARPRDAGPPLRHQYGVGHRQFGGRVTAEDELRLDRPVAHLRGLFLRPRARNSSSACATTAEIVRPDSRACSRTAPASRAGTLTVNTTVASGTGTRPDAAAWSTYRRAFRGEQPNRPASTRAAPGPR